MTVGATCGGRLIATSERKSFLMNREISTKCEFEIISESSLQEGINFIRI